MVVRRLGVEEEIEFKIGSITDIPFEGESFSEVASYNTLDHVQGVG